MKYGFEAIGRDLFFDLECKKCHGTRKLTGYADDYFFDVVNGNFRSIECECGAKIYYKWCRDGIEVVE